MIVFVKKVYLVIYFLQNLTLIFYLYFYKKTRIYKITNYKKTTRKIIYCKNFTISINTYPYKSSNQNYKIKN